MTSSQGWLGCIYDPSGGRPIILGKRDPVVSKQDWGLPNRSFEWPKCGQAAEGRNLQVLQRGGLVSKILIMGVINISAQEWMFFISS